jgi:hypothetical protein
MIDLIKNKIFDLSVESQTVIVNLEFRSAQGTEQDERGTASNADQNSQADNYAREESELKLC